jgi:hypothetical protein
MGVSADTYRRQRNCDISEIAMPQLAPFQSDAGVLGLGSRQGLSLCNPVIHHADAYTTTRLSPWPEGAAGADSRERDDSLTAAEAELAWPRARAGSSLPSVFARVPPTIPRRQRSKGQ